MLPVDHRLRDSSAFRRAVRSGRRAGGPVLVVHLLEPDAASNAPRAGFVVSKAVGNAVVRNRVRRRLRHIVKRHLSTLSPSAELVVRALPAAAELSSAELDAELARCLKRIRSSEAAS